MAKYRSTIRYQRSLLCGWLPFHNQRPRVMLVVLDRKSLTNFSPSSVLYMGPLSLHIPAPTILTAVNTEFRTLEAPEDAVDSWQTPRELIPVGPPEFWLPPSLAGKRGTLGRTNSRLVQRTVRGVTVYQWWRDNVPLHVRTDIRDLPRGFTLRPSRDGLTIEVIPN